jgi:hypothetical protein
VSVNAEGAAVFRGTSYTHEIVVEGARVALAESLPEAKIVARALSRVLPSTQEARVYAAFATTPHSSFVSGWEVK